MNFRLIQLVLVVVAFVFFLPCEASAKCRPGLLSRLRRADKVSVSKEVVKSKSLFRHRQCANGSCS